MHMRIRFYDLTASLGVNYIIASKDLFVVKPGQTKTAEEDRLTLSLSDEWGGVKNVAMRLTRDNDEKEKMVTMPSVCTRTF